MTDRNTPSPDDLELIEATKVYAEMTRAADADERIDRDDINEPSLTFGMLRAILADRAKLEERVAQQQGEIKALCDVVSEHTRARAALNRSADRG